MITEFVHFLNNRVLCFLPVVSRAGETVCLPVSFNNRSKMFLAFLLLMIFVFHYLIMRLRPNER